MGDDFVLGKLSRSFKIIIEQSESNSYIPWDNSERTQQVYEATQD